MSCETGVQLTVYADHDYRFRVSGPDELLLEYLEDGRSETPMISFGSLEEMEAVAKAMLTVVRLARGEL